MDEEFKGISGLHTKFKVIQDCVRPCLKKPKPKGKQDKALTWNQCSLAL